MNIKPQHVKRAGIKEKLEPYGGKRTLIELNAALKIWELKQDPGYQNYSFFDKMKKRKAAAAKTK